MQPQCDVTPLRMEHSLTICTLKNYEVYIHKLYELYIMISRKNTSRTYTHICVQKLLESV